MLSLRLTVLCEAALVNGDVSLEIIDLMDQARRLLNVALEDQRSFRGYEAQAANKGGRRGRPNFSISEEQLVFFKGSKSSFSFNIIRNYTQTAVTNIRYRRMTFNLFSFLTFPMLLHTSTGHNLIKMGSF